MKNKIKSFISLLFILMISCNNQSKIENKVEKYVKRNFHDPKSYELIELKLIDTVSESAAAKYMNFERENYIKNIKKYISSKNQEISQEAQSIFFAGPTFTTNSDVEKLKEKKAELLKYNDTIEIQKKEIKILNKYLKSKKPLYVKYLHEYRAKNNEGVLLKTIDTLRFDLQDSIIENKDIYMLKKLK